MPNETMVISSNLLLIFCADMSKKKKNLPDPLNLGNYKENCFFFFLKGIKKIVISTLTVSLGVRFRSIRVRLTLKKPV
jgi:hypothetical protein